MTDKEILEKRLDLFTDESWGIFTKELTSMAESLENIQTIDDEKTLYLRRGQVDILNMIINLEVIDLILKNELEKARLKIKKMPYNLKKFKYLMALLLPNNFVKKFIQF